MERKYLIIAAVVIATLLGIVIFDQLDSKSPTQNTATVDKPTGQTGDSECKPTFADGGGPYYQPNSPFREKIVPDENNGEKLVVQGKVLRNDCQTPAANVVVDIWQANETGNYHDEWYRGQVQTDADGNYRFESVIPQGYGEGSGFRPPHIHFKIWESEREVITSQMFFPESKGKTGFDDAYIMNVRSEGSSHEGYHDIVLP